MSAGPLSWSELFDELVQRTDARVDHRGWAHCTCPFCGHEPVDSKTGRFKVHFSFSREGSCKCYSCSQSGSLRDMADALGHEQRRPLAPLPPRRVQTPQEPRQWQRSPESYLERYCAHWHRVERWQAYKPLTLDSIARWRLGVGTLPSSPCQHERLIYPVIEAGQIVGLRGRAIQCDCDKWISAGGSTARLWGADLLRPGARVIIAENPVDAMLAMQETPGIIAVAGTAGASTWPDDWTKRIAESQPEAVLHWGDNDLAANPNRETYRREILAWRKAHPGATSWPEPKSPKIVAALVAAGVHAECYVWPDGTPHKADLGWLIEQTLRQAA